MSSELDYIPVAAELLPLLNAQLAWHYRIVPHAAAASHLELYTDSERATPALADELEVVLGRRVLLHAAPAAQIERTLSKYFIRQGNDNGAAPGPATTVSKTAAASDDFLPPAHSGGPQPGQQRHSHRGVFGMGPHPHPH